MSEEKKSSMDMQQRLLSILEGTRAGTWEWNVQTGETVFNETWANMIGYELREISPTSIQTWIDYSHPDDLSQSNELLEKHFRGELDYYECEARMRHKDGHWVWVLDRGKVLSWTEEGKPLWMFGTHQDISERKQAEVALRDSEEQLRLFIEHAPASLAMLDREMRYLAVSRRWCRDFTQGDRNLIGKSHYDILPEIPMEWRETHRRALAGEVLRSEGDRLERADGSVQWLKREVRPWQDAAGKVGGIVILTEDITERKLAEKLLRDSEERFQQMFRNHDAVMLLIAPGTDAIVDANTSACAYFGYSLEQFLKITPRDIYSLSGEEFDHAITLALKGEQNHFECSIRLASGENREIEAHASPIIVNGQSLLFCVIHDITERKKLFEEHRKSAQLAALGTVAAGVAHEINSPIQGILNYATLMQNTPGNEARVLDFSQRIIKEIDRIACITRALIHYAKDQKAEMCLVDVQELVESAISLIETKMRREGVSIQVEFPEPLPSITAQPQAVQQIVINLVDNACHALLRKEMPAEKRVVYVTGTMITIDQGSALCLEVFDHGIGMSKSVLDKAKDAFFSTKPSSEGTGLGLSIVSDIVSKHKGLLDIVSEEGEYTKVKVVLPTHAHQVS